MDSSLDKGLQGGSLLNFIEFNKMSVQMLMNIPRERE